MPPKKALNTEDATTTIAMTEGETKFIKAVFDNMTARPDADWEKVAADLRLKDAKCAKERFRQMSVKHGWRETGGSSSGSGSGSAVTTPRKKTTLPKATSASKVTKQRTPRKPKKSTPKAASSTDEDVDEDEDMFDLSKEEKPAKNKEEQAAEGTQEDAQEDTF